MGVLAINTALLALVTLGNGSQIGFVLFVSHHLRWPLAKMTKGTVIIVGVFTINIALLLLATLENAMPIGLVHFVSHHLR